MNEIYTAPFIVDACLSKLDLESYSFILEPAAGDGRILSKLPPTAIGIDINPKSPGIKKMSFYNFPNVKQDNGLIIMNPPYRLAGKEAVKFFNKASAIVDTIAIIGPRTFENYRVHSMLNKEFNLVESWWLPKFSFTKEGKPFDLRSVFQIWKRQPTGYRLYSKPVDIVHNEVELVLNGGTMRPHLKSTAHYTYKYDIGICWFGVGKVLRPHQLMQRPSCASYMLCNASEIVIDKIYELDLEPYCDMGPSIAPSITWNGFIKCYDNIPINLLIDYE